MLYRHLAFGLLAGMTVLFGGCGNSSPNSIGDEALSNFQIEGTWSGELHQKGIQPFEVTARIGDLHDPASNTVHYTGIDCWGNWTYLGRSGEDYRFHEVIDRGAGGSCKGSGLVTLTPESEANVTYRFRGGGIVSSGDLIRGG